MSNHDTKATASFHRNKNYLLEAIDAYPDNPNVVVVDCVMLLHMFIKNIDDPQLRTDLYNVVIQSIEGFKK